MQELIITKDQAQTIFKVLVEFPAKDVIVAIDILRSLKVLEKKEEVK